MIIDLKFRIKGFILCLEVVFCDLEICELIKGLLDFKV